MFRYLIIVALAFLQARSSAQNLIINGDFEKPYNKDSFETGRTFHWSLLSTYADPVGWPHAYRKGSDFFEAVPQSQVGFQNPQSGNSYLGLACYDDEMEFRDYVVGELSTKLKANQEYEFHLYINLADYSGYSINSLGVAVLPDSDLRKLTKYNYSVLEIANHELLNVNFSDSTNWVAFRVSFKANGNEDRILLGCFKHDKDLGISRNLIKSKSKSRDKTLKRGCYFLIDNVSLIEVKNL